ncbi:MBL fold metallo-hydrolase [Streptomyces sp. NPDC102360]|uniref:MBL fold metallo-hydrolase n=1 Tax=Streptomyces sp. NPDC102360 TaxID=3366160 RepID=UPI0037FB565E
MTMPSTAGQNDTPEPQHTTPPTEFDTRGAAGNGPSRRSVLAATAGAGTTALAATTTLATPAAAAQKEPAKGHGATARTPHESMTWTTLGTASGPIPDAHRAQPAHLLRTANAYVLVDAGDGVVDQIAKAGIALEDVRTVFLSHLHIDHTGGLWALIGRRFQLADPGTLVIYGPAGTRRTVDGILAGQQPLHDLAQGRGSTQEVIEIDPENTIEVDGVKVRATINTHYGPADSVRATASPSLSYRFESARRTIVFTGDTGPSTAVEHLAQGADLLVSEIIDVEDALRQLIAGRPDLTSEQLAGIRAHFEQEHLTADQVGLLARRAAVGSLALTHIGMSDGAVPDARRSIRRHFKGPTTFARDLDSF